MAPKLSPTPETLVTRGWSDYALLDSGDGKKLERYGGHTVVRPEPQCFWSPRDPAAFDAANAVFDPQQEEEDSGPKPKMKIGSSTKLSTALPIMM